MIATLGLSILNSRKTIASEKSIPEGYIKEETRLTKIKGSYNIVICGFILCNEYNFREDIDYL